MTTRIALVGFGNVGRALAHTLLAAGAPFTVTAIGTARHGAVVDADGIDLATILAGTDLPLRALPSVRELPADVLVEITTLDPRTGEPALTHIREALAAGMHVVTANKGPIARAYRDLERLAREHGRLLRFEATLADCLPVFTLRRAALPLAEIRSVRGIVSSTCNYILSQCAAGAPFSEALAEAQRLGIAEADPRNDLEGHDAAAKAAILANVLMDADIRPEDVERRAIDDAAGDAARVAAAEGARVRPLIEVEAHAGRVRASFGPRRLAPLDPLYAVDGFSMGLAIDTDLAGRVVVQLHDPHVDQVAYAILTDLLEIAARTPPSWIRPIGAASVITDDRDRVLLVRHTYGELNWEIPGGGSEPGESAAATSRREVREEVGVDIRLDRLAGVYWEPGWRPSVDMHHFVFRASIVGGTPRPSSPEIGEVRWCDPSDLPRPISDFTVRRIRDALAGGAATVGDVPRRRWLR